MVDQRILTKTIPPDLSRTLSRPRLVNKITDADTSRIILITGQAAQGKSTLAAEIIRQSGPPGTWMHLDSSDSDPINFFRLLVQSVHAYLPRREASTFLKHSAIEWGTKAPLDRIAALTDVLLDKILVAQPIRIVVDGLDRLADAAESLTLIRHILQRLSPPSILVLVSRRTPPLALESFRMQQQLIHLDNVDLSFTCEEIGRFYSMVYDFRVSSSQQETIRRITDGWVGGLVLVWEALRRVPQKQRNAFIEDGLQDALHSKGLAYFSEEVFSGLDEKRRAFLIRSSVFDTVDPTLLSCCLDPPAEVDAKAIISEMVSRNMFIHPLYDEKSGWGYRYNQLFRDFLLDKFYRVLDTQSRRRFFSKAADLTWNRGHFEESIRFFLLAKAFDKAAAGIKRIAMGLSAQGRFSDLAGWIDHLPEQLVDEDAWLFFYRCVGRRISGGRRNIEAFLQSLQRFDVAGDQRGQLLALAYLIEAAVFIGHPVPELRRWLKSAWQLLEKASHNRLYPFAKALLWMQVAFGHISGTGNIQKGLSASRNAVLLANTIEDERIMVNATIVYVFGCTMAGEFSKAEKELAGIQKMMVAAYPEYRALRHLVRAELALSKGDLERARELLEVNQEAIEKFGLLFLYPIQVDLFGLLQIHQGRFDAVGGTAHHLNDVATLAANPLYNGLALRLLALKAYHLEFYERALSLAEQAVEIIEQSIGESIHLFRSRLVLGMAAYHLGKFDVARDCLEAACRFFDRVASQLSLTEARLGLSLVARGVGDEARAETNLEWAVATVSAKGYTVFPILSNRDVIAACMPAFDHPIANIALVRLLLDRLSTAPFSQKAGSAKRLKKAFLRIQGARFDFEIRTFGAFEVRRGNGDLIPEKNWSGLRQKLLLKAILVHGCREIPKDVLMDTLWPESSQSAALKRFKITLHRLRRSLQPDRRASEGGSYILLKDGLVSLDLERCRVDVNDFLTACDQIRQVQREDNDFKLLSVCRRAADLYRGDFLPEEPYLSPVEVKRAALRQRYLSVLKEMVALFERKGDLEEAIRCCSAVVREDPLAEQIHQKLMRLLVQRGRHSAAVKVYRDLAAALAQELDTHPDPATTRLYHSIVEH